MRVYFSFELRKDLRLSLIEEFPNVDFIFTAVIDEQELEKADVLVTYGEDLVSEHIEIAKCLKWIFVASAGIEKMPAKAIAARDILVSNVRGIHKIPMAESILAHILSLKRSLPWMYEQKAKGEWSRQSRFTELKDSTALIIGPGAIGSEVGRLLQAFGVKTIGCNRSGVTAPFMDEMVNFNDLTKTLPQADIVLSMLPSTAETYHLYTQEHFEAMKDSAIFMNFGRGSVVSTDVLVHALQEGQIHHAVLDVFEEEPLQEGHIFWSLGNVTVSPHVSSHSSRYLERSLEIFKPSLAKWIKGERDLENTLDVLKGY